MLNSENKQKKDKLIWEIKNKLQIDKNNKSELKLNSGLKKSNTHKKMKIRKRNNEDHRESC